MLLDALTIKDAAGWAAPEAHHESRQSQRRQDGSLCHCNMLLDALTIKDAASQAPPEAHHASRQSQRRQDGSLCHCNMVLDALTIKDAAGWAPPEAHHESRQSQRRQDGSLCHCDMLLDTHNQRRGRSAGPLLKLTTSHARVSAGRTGLCVTVTCCLILTIKDAAGWAPPEAHHKSRQSQRRQDGSLGHCDMLLDALTIKDTAGQAPPEAHHKSRQSQRRQDRSLCHCEMLLDTHNPNSVLMTL